MAISQNFPNTRPSLNLNFARSQTLDPRIDFIRPQGGNEGSTYINKNGFIVYANPDEPRFNYDIETGECLGLLIEQLNVNLYTRSDIEGTIGEKPTGMGYAGSADVNGNRPTVSEDYFIGPNGKSCKHTRGSNSDSNIGYFGASVEANKLYTFSAWVYIPESQQSNFSGKSIGFYMENNFENRVNAIADTSIVGKWQRVVGTATVDANNAGGGTLTSQTWVCRTTAAAGSFFYTDAWQIEKSQLATSYIPSRDGQQYSRPKEYPTIDGTNFTDFYNPTEGTIYVKYNINGPFGVDGFNRVVEVSDGGNQNRLTTPLLRNDNEQVYEGLIVNNNQQIGFNTCDITFGDFYKYICAFKQDDFQRYAINKNGIIDSNSDSTSPSFDLNSFNPIELNIGHEAVSDGRQLNGHISQLIYYPSRLSNDQLQTLLLQ